MVKENNPDKCSISDKLVIIEDQLRQIQTQNQKMGWASVVLSALLSITIALSGYLWNQTRTESTINNKFLQAIALQDIKDYRAAEEKWLEAAKFAEGAGYKELAAQYYYAAGSIAEETKKFKNAENHYTLAISLRRNWTAAYNARALIYEKQERYQNALKDLDKAISHDKKNPYLRINRGGIRLRANDCPGAIKDLEKALQMFGDNDIEAKRELKQAKNICE